MKLNSEELKAEEASIKNPDIKCLLVQYYKMKLKNTVTEEFLSGYLSSILFLIVIKKIHNGKHI